MEQLRRIETIKELGALLEEAAIDHLVEGGFSFDDEYETGNSKVDEFLRELNRLVREVLPAAEAEERSK